MWAPKPLNSVCLPANVGADCLFVCLSVCLLLHLFVYLSVSSFIYLFIYLYSLIFHLLFVCLVYFIGFFVICSVVWLFGCSFLLPSHVSGRPLPALPAAGPRRLRPAANHLPRLAATRPPCATWCVSCVRQLQSMLLPAATSLSSKPHCVCLSVCLYLGSARPSLRTRFLSWLLQRPHCVSLSKKPLPNSHRALWLGSFSCLSVHRRSRPTRRAAGDGDAAGHPAGGGAF
jgi:hypothetical protein